MADDCIFCRIAAGTAEASVVHSDDLVMAFLDIRQFHPGHTLVIPRTHIPDIHGLDDARLGAALLTAIANVARRVRDVLEPDGVNIWQSTGEAAGQEVFHLHFHVLPRHEKDGLLRFYPTKPDHPGRNELDALAARLRVS